jgi:CRP-like cAMP-binding protein
MSSIECQLPTYGELIDDQIVAINSSSFIVLHKKEEIILKQNTPVSHLIYVKSGLVKVYKEITNEKVQIFKIASSGNFIGLLSVFSGNRNYYSVGAIEDCEIVYTDITTVKNIIKENGGFALHLLKLISDYGLFISDKLINVSNKQIPGRIAETILFFADEIYKNDAFELPLSRQELAEMVVTTKENISRTLSEFKNDRLIEFDGRKIIIKSRENIEFLSKTG